MTSSSGLRARTVGVLVTVMLPVALRWLQPPKLFSRNTIDESLPPGTQSARRPANSVDRESACQAGPATAHIAG